MKVEDLVEILGADFYTGVPDSQLKPFCNYLMKVYGMDRSHHVIAANEGNCTALAAGYFLATKKIPVVYMQNSGEGNAINPITSLLHEKVYAIPVLFIIGWRGEPGTRDEPQHCYQGEVTEKLLKDMGIAAFIVGKETTKQEVMEAMEGFSHLLKTGKSVAFLIRKGALSYEETIEYKNCNKISREEAIQHIIEVSGSDLVVSTTGKASRELFELREAKGQGHQYDFLTVGSMGHCLSIAMGIAFQKPECTLWCIDGDGAALMHMGSMAVLGAYAPKNLIHIILNNGAHETVGGMPTVANKIQLAEVARACQYPYAVSVNTIEELEKELKEVKNRKELSIIEVMCSLEARSDLGRPTTTALENKKNFMEYLGRL